MVIVSPRLTVAAVIITSSVSMILASQVVPRLHKSSLWPHNTFTSMTVGDYVYRVQYQKDSLGSVSFPPDDSKGKRVMALPDPSMGESQLQESVLHEELHACMHNHDHNFLSPSNLQDHLQKKTYTEEDIVEMIAPCLIAQKQKAQALSLF